IQKKQGLNTSEVHRPNSKTKVIDHLIRIANKKDEFEYRFEQSSLAKKILTRIFLTILDLYQALLLGLVLIFGTKLKDSNIQQNDLDLRRYRVKYYPTVTTIGISFIILLSQLFLYVTGGIIILNTKVISIFAIGDGDSEILFVEEEIDNFIFDEQFIEFDANGASLVEIQEPQADEPPTPTEILPTEIIIEPSIEPTDIPNPTNEAIPSVEPSEVPTNTPIQSPQPTDIPEVLGANTEEQTEVAYQYPSTSPELVTKNGIEYSYLESIVEQSEINNEQTSTQTDSEYQVNSATNISISYQLSPDSESWYYYDATELIWERTDQAVSSSNSIQEINQNLDSYNDQFGAGELFFKIFLISDGSEDITINSLIVSKEDSLLASNEDYSPETSEVDQLANIDDSLLIDTEPVLFNANYFNGHKVVKGKLLPKDDTLSRVIDIDESILTDYQANIYFSDSQSATKGELIGTTDLYLNQRGEIEFFLSEPSSPGGFVTAEIVNKNSDFTSELAKPLKNATFVIDTTLDLYDAGDTDNVGFVDNPDGLCDDGTGYCSMRAAVFESNNNSEADVLSFDIPYSDPGYLDYDGGPGDIPANGDDFWQMKPSLINTES
ncbi:hypothetical protein KC909_06645, partial [Candidatus Dojkabacteria bacterium]|nr:hypothetical protein [Candidatus Dojkabacteria bacterium]